MDTEDLVGDVVKACRTAIDTALADPRQALSLASRLESSLKTLQLVAAESGKGTAGLAAVLDNAPALTRSALLEVLRISEPGKSAGSIDVDAALASLSQPDAGSATPSSNPSPADERKRIPLFSEVSRKYIALRADNGAGKPELDTLELRRKTFLDVVGDRPVDEYYPRDLQQYVTQMGCWPANVTKRLGAAAANWNTKDILAANQDLHEKPIARKTMQDGYVANIRTMARAGCGDHNYRDPFAGARLRWPVGFRLSARREGIDFDVLNKLFENGVNSGCIDEAILPLFLLLTGRRLSLALYLRGSDLRRKHGQVLGQSAGIVFSGGKWTRIPVKNEESTGSFVIHEFFEAIGFVAWAMTRFDNWLFPQPHQHSDPSRYESKLLNRRLVDAGAKGGSIETIHSLRGDAISNLRRAQVGERTAKLQSGHSFTDEHDMYGNHGLERHEAIAVATRDLSPEINWSIFNNLDFDALAKGRRERGRKGEN